MTRPAPHPQAPPGRRHLLTFALEEYFNNFGRLIDRAHWPRFERRVEHGTRRVLDLLDAHGQRATFFCLGWAAEHLPDLVAEIARRGHEVASKGYAQRSLRALTPSTFREDLARGRDAIERVTGTRVLGYRAPGWLGATDTWALDVLAAEGYAYDSSVKPFLRYPRGGEVPRYPQRLDRPAGALWELPVSAVRLGGWHLPVGAGNYSRQLPHWLMRRVLDRWDRVHEAPLVLCFHAWEFDADQPQISAAPWLVRTRIYRNLDKAPDILAAYLARFRFTGAAEYLGLTPAPVAPAPLPAAACAPVRLAAPRPAADPPVGVSLVVPCYDEERTLPYLANTLDSVRESLAGRYTLEVVFVDDGSTDGTAAELDRRFGARADCRVVRHAGNRGVGQAILTGAAHARYDVIASIDCDCTYDPHELGRMLPLLTGGTDVVTGSPYHPDGGVRNVPAWRLVLSRSASRCYRRVLRQKLCTYTSCFRVYRRAALQGLTLTHGGFLGVAETLGRLDLAGARIAEFPTTLHVRVLGRSKMKVARTIGGHLVLLTQLATLRARDARDQRRQASKAAPQRTPRPDAAAYSRALPRGISRAAEMTPVTWQRLPSSTHHVCAALLTAGLAAGPAAAAQTPSADAAGAAVATVGGRAAAARPLQLRPGDVVKLYVWREPEMSRDYEVNSDGAIELPKLGPVAVTGVSSDSLRRLLEGRYAKYLRTPTVEVSLRRRISVLGSVRNPGVYQVDPYVSVADALALAGGTTPEARADEVRVLRGNQTLRTRLSRRTILADSPVQSGDQLYVSDRGWVSRNLPLISAVLSAGGVLVFALNR